jgi:response regulator NasT
VDDDRLVLSTLASGLERLGYRVTSAVSGASAREAAATQRFDLAVLDVRLADDDGLELAQQLRAREPLPIVFLSAFDDRAYVERAVSEGGFAYLVKPVTPAQLAPLIESVLARCRDLSASRRSEDTLRGALAREREVSLAVGLIMERQRMSAHDAFELLRRRARNERRRVADVAREVIGAAEALNALGSPTLDVPPAPDE